MRVELIDRCGEMPAPGPGRHHPGDPVRPQLQARRPEKADLAEADRRARREGGPGKGTLSPPQALMKKLGAGETAVAEFNEIGCGLEDWSKGWFSGLC